MAMVVVMMMVVMVMRVAGISVWSVVLLVQRELEKTCKRAREDLRVKVKSMYRVRYAKYL